jgi:hypothetical protein
VEDPSGNEDVLIAIEVDGDSGKSIPELRVLLEANEKRISPVGRRYGLIVWGKQGTSGARYFTSTRGLLQALSTIRLGAEIPNSKSMNPVASAVSTARWRKDAKKRVIFLVAIPPKEEPEQLVLWAEKEQARVEFIQPRANSALLDPASKSGSE